MKVVISMKILCFRLSLLAGYLGLKLNKSLSKLNLPYKQRKLKRSKINSR